MNQYYLGPRKIPKNIFKTISIFTGLYLHEIAEKIKNMLWGKTRVRDLSIHEKTRGQKPHAGC